MLAHRNHSHAQCLRALHYRTSDTAETEYAEGCACNFPDAWQFIPEDLLAPKVFFLKAYGSWDFFGQGKDEREDVFSHYGPMHLTRIGQNDFAVDQFRKHQLMDR